ncbi:MAG: deoxyribonuclease IV [Candidatus Yanofskybacteria bacterium]|nr:deoxyribonuclease IV [Candidatus Yanofskybacteria bacterium]
MNKIGAHVSIAGGIFHAPTRARDGGCETFQCFSRSPQGGPAPALTDEVVSQFKRNMEESSIDRFVIHAPYYINLASPNAPVRHASRRIIREELERGSTLGASFVMFHPGSHTGRPLEEGVAAVQKGLEEILRGYTGSCELLVEISAGAGQVLGDTFQENADMIRPVLDATGFGGVCFDTCHAFASGYDFRTTTGVAAVLREFDATIGLKHLRLTHVNDSKTDLGGHKDRHEHIGKGFIDTEGIASILQTPAFARIDWILETESEGQDKDIAALRAIRENTSK